MTIILVLSSFAFSQEIKQQDEFGSTLGCDGYIGIMDGVRSYLLRNPNSKIYFLIYEGREEKHNKKLNKDYLVFPIYGETKARISSMQARLKMFENEKLLERTVFVEAGFRQTFTIEVWSVPNGATPPKPTPTVKKMKYRKGKPKGFCDGCC